MINLDSIWGPPTAAPNDSVTSVSIKNQTIDLGITDTTKILQGEFSLKNTGEIDLIIEDVIVSCLCTVVDWPRDPIPPNKSIIIKVVYHPRSRGFFNQVIQVICNVNDSVVLLILKGKII